MKCVEKVVITGGTHGNELTGVYLVNKFKKNPQRVQRDGFETIVRHTNLCAIEKCVRYVEKDLNRCFSLSQLNNPDNNSYEDLLAKEINAEFGPKGTDVPKVDFMVDLHSTTSNMGLSVIIDNMHELTWQAAAYLKEKVPEVRIFYWKGDTGESDFVHSIAPDGFAIEVGAVPQGVLRADIFMKTEALVYHLLDFFEQWNAGRREKKEGTIEVYDHKELVDFPRDENGEIIAMVHPELQDNDFKVLQKGDPLFLSLEGETLIYDKDEPLHAVFVNEAAYYEKGFAMCLSERKEMQLP